MKYCVDYTPKSIKMNVADEINVPFNKDDVLLLLNFLERHKAQRTNIYIKDLEECLQYKIIEKMIKIKKEHPDFNFSLRFNAYNSDLPIQLLQEAGMDFFFNIGITQWEALLKILSLGVSDVYITGGLGFELDKAAAAVHKNNARVRVFPNLSQRTWDGIPAIKTFFVRPEDTEAYEKYVDIFEFYGDREKHDLYYEIYAENKEWYGKINEIIIDLDLDFTLDSKYTIPRFGEKRTTCNRECLKGGKCQICERIEELSKTLEKANLIVKLKEED